MKPSLKRMISAVISLVLVIAAVIIFVNYIKPEYAILEQNKATVLAQNAEIETKNSVDQLISGQGKEYENGSSYRKAFAIVLPLTPAVDAALFQLSGLAGQNDISLMSLSVSEVAPVVSESARRNPNSLESMVSKPRTVSFTIAAMGAYDDFKNFLRNIEQNVRIFDVKEVSIQPAISNVVPAGTKGQTQTPIYNYSLTVQTYYQSM